MFREAYAPSFEYFHPVGNTPAVNLLSRDSPTRVDAASGSSTSDEDNETNLLLLDCGDIRNVPHTVEQQSLTESSPRLTFFCCDPEPAVIARNLLAFGILFAILDSLNDHTNRLTTLWSIYYHYFLPANDVNTLKQLINTLWKSTSNPNEWSALPLSRIVHFHEGLSLMKVHGIFCRYKAILDDEVRTKILQVAFKDHLKTMPVSSAYSSIVESNMRADGSIQTQVYSWLAKNLPKYYRAGVVSERLYDILFTRILKQFNVTYAVSGGSHTPSLDSKTDFLQAFHHDNAFAAQPDTSQGLESFIGKAKEQFNSWCRSWINACTLDKVRIVMLSGVLDVVCPSLQGQILEERHKQQIALDHGSQTSKHSSSSVVPRDGFDVIHYSSTYEYFGPWKVLSNTIPLLRRSFTSVLFTEFKLLRNVNPAKVVTEILGLEVQELAVLFGSSSSTRMSHESMSAFVSAYLIDLLAPTARGSRARLTWRLFNEVHDSNKQNSGFDCRVNHALVSALLIKLYDWMFLYESQPFNIPAWQQAALGRPVTTDITLDARHNRASYAGLINMIRNLIQTNWDACITNLMVYFTSHEFKAKGSVHARSYHDLFVQLQRKGVLHTTPVTPPSMQAVFAGPFSGIYTPPPGTGILTTADLPSMVYVTLKVPHVPLRALLQATLNKKPRLIPFHLSIVHATWLQNDFSEIFQVFGTEGSSNGDRHMRIRESPGGVFGSDALFITALISTTSLLLGPPASARVRMEIKPEQGRWDDFLCTKYGCPPVVYAAPLLSAGNVWIQRHAPFIDGVSSEEN